MTVSLRTQGAVRELEAALAMPDVPDRVARSFEALADRLRKPVRVAILGVEARRRRGLLCAILGRPPFPLEADWPTIEISFAERPHTSAILSDGSALSAEGMPGADLLARAPAFVGIKAPNEVLKRMTFLYLAAGPDRAEQAAALRWALPRTDVAVWCTRKFTAREAAIWAAAPDGIKHHAHLAVMGDDSDFAVVEQGCPADFEHLIALPTPDAAPLLRCIDDSIDAALREDLDTARIMMHRFGVTPPAEGEDRAKPALRDGHEPDERVGVLSEPLLFLRRRARAIFELMDWQDPDTDTWASMVLEHCRETTEALRERATSWPDEVEAIVDLRQLLQDAADMTVLLQIEGGEDQAADAAALLCQIRNAFERALAPAGPKSNRETR
jgi:hypothetical protein